jgi:hypothetical protein
LEKILLREIGRSLGIAFSWGWSNTQQIKSCVKKKYREAPHPQQIEVEKKVP